MGKLITIIRTKPNTPKRGKKREWRRQRAMLVDDIFVLLIGIAIAVFIIVMSMKIAGVI